MIYAVLIFLEILILYFLSRNVVKGIHRFIYRVTGKRNWTTYLFAVLFLPGTFIHEISHFLAALFLLVPVGKLELIPKIEERGGSKLGSVAIAKTDPIRRFLIGVAPLVFGLGIILTLTYSVLMVRIISTGWGYIITGIIIFQIANSMFASKKDLEGAIVLFVILFVIILILILLGVDITVIFTEFEANQNVLKLIKRTALFLLVPIIIDSLVLLPIHRCIGSK